jgi:hypothetical protein
VEWIVKKREKKELKNKRVSKLKMMKVKRWKFILMKRMMKTKSMGDDM